jgi:hypothetical protein
VRERWGTEKQPRTGPDRNQRNPTFGFFAVITNDGWPVAPSTRYVESSTYQPLFLLYFSCGSRLADIDLDINVNSSKLHVHCAMAGPPAMYFYEIAVKLSVGAVGVKR